MNQHTKKQHFVSQFYLRNFANPIFSKNLCVYDLQEKCWQRRTTKGVGWSSYIFSMIEMDGQWTDAFDQFINENVENPAAPALKKLALREQLSEGDKKAVALFVAATIVRSPEMSRTVLGQHLESLSTESLAELEHIVRIWCQWVDRPYDSNAYAEFLKPSSFGAIWINSQHWAQRILGWEWQVCTTSRDKPFIASDWPVFAQRGHGMSMVSFPVSSEVALVFIDGGKLNEERDHAHEVTAINCQTLSRALKFVVACQESFPGDQFLRDHRIVT